ncbi:hypothetical protein [Streptomyces sp. WAC 04229]|uniref:hypothetical protein n=1 Tax=Streptomyces sp. WAC 04229 TaxID=2203206 RepID=UPI003D7276DF
MSVVRGIEKPGDSSTNGNRPCAGRASMRAWVRTPLTVAAGTTPAKPRASSSNRASSSVM